MECGLNNLDLKSEEFDASLCVFGCERARFCFIPSLDHENTILNIDKIYNLNLYIIDLNLSIDMFLFFNSLIFFTWQF